MKREARQQSILKSAFYYNTETSHVNDDIIDEPIDYTHKVKMNVKNHC